MSKSEQHTAGPWSIGPVALAPTSTRIVAGMNVIASAYGMRHSENAKLIAAAPSLLAALQRILYAHDTKNCGASMGEAVLCRAYAEQAREAIQKATGEAE